MPIPSPSRRLDRLTDPQLIARCLSGDARAWDALLERYESLIYSALRRAGLTPADADDVFQEVCLSLLNHLESLRDTQRLSGWLLSVARCQAWRVHKRRRAGRGIGRPGRAARNRNSLQFVVSPAPARSRAAGFERAASGASGPGPPGRAAAICWNCCMSPTR